MHTSEALETETHQVIEWLMARAKALATEANEGRADLAIAEGRPIGFALSPAGDRRRVLTLEDLHFADDDKRAHQERKEAIRKALAGGTLIVDAGLKGLHDGLLDPTAKHVPPTADSQQSWLPPIDGEPVVRFRIRPVSADTGEQGPTDRRWGSRLRFATTVSEDGEPGGWLLIEKWQSDSATEEDRGIGHCQLLADHQRLAEEHARDLARRLDLPGAYAEMLALVARLHDEGKKAHRWQRAFKAPTDGVYAKTQGPIDFSLLDGYRHEFQSLAVASSDPDFVRLPSELQDLALHLIVTHHGFGRPVISIRGCDAPPSVLEGRAREVALRFARLQRRWGPWGLAWWESLLRAADHQASRENDAAEVDRV